ncbi:MAG: substrate-binding domain-containing protein, partial [Gemmatimonadales bacterium]
VYRSDVTQAIAPHVRVLEIPGDYNAVASYPIAVLRDAGNPDAAGAFIALVLGAEGQRVLRQHGLIPAGTS